MKKREPKQRSNAAWLDHRRVNLSVLGAMVADDMPAGMR